MRYLLFIACVLGMHQANCQQFRYDNNLFKTVYPEDLCNTLKENNDYFLLDVRSRGEYYDTASYQGANMGHFKGAKNITIGELAQRWREIESEKNKPVFIYCSHSQRSRRASKMLADSGFTNIFNINGGMTDLVKKKSSLPPCFRELYESGVPYKMVSHLQIMDMAASGNPYFIIDIRPDSVFKGISTTERLNAQGRFASSVNISASMIEASLSKIPKDKPILVVDSYGDQSPVTARLLINLGYKDVSVLFDGIDTWLENTLDIPQTGNVKWSSTVKYKIISPKGFTVLLKQHPSAVIVDIRNKDQFSNQSKNSWENIGHIKNARSIPYENFESGISETVPDKNTPLVLYTFSNQGDVYEAARKLVNKGYGSVHILYGGIWNIRWSAYNRKGDTYLKDWVVGIPPENQ